MNSEHVELLRRLEQFQMDSPDAAAPFSARLARENQWSPEHTQRAITEYKRFAFLAVAAGHPVSPSEDVDQVWHLHLTYSENYWKEFCPNVLGKPLHHHPSKGGHTEKEKFEDWYARTLESYRKFFGEAPPREIWPAPAEHRSVRHDFIRLDRSRNWVIPKPRLHLIPAAVAAFAFIALMFCCCGAMLGSGLTVFDWRGPEFLNFYLTLLVAGFGLAFLLRSMLRQPQPSQPLNVPELDGYSTAFLNGGKILAVNTAIANLAQQGAIHVDGSARRLTSVAPSPQLEHELERAVYKSALGGKAMAEVRQSAKAAGDNIAQKLRGMGLAVPDIYARRAIAIPLLLALSILAVGVVKIGIGLSRGKPVGFLVGLSIAALVVALISFARRPLRSRYGDAVLNELKARHVGPRRLSNAQGAIPAPEFAMLVGLFGMTALAGTPMDDVRKSLQTASAGVDGSGCGGSCGGGGCGGGCGGCGGCGGD